MAYGYDPSRYIRDFSWVGQIGNVLAGAAQKMPELLEMNRMINEDDKYKEKSFEAANKWVDSMDDSTVSNLASSMQIAESGDNANSLREKIRAMIPEPTLGTKSLDNKTYTMNLVESFGTPILRAAGNELGSGPLTIGDLIKGAHGDFGTGLSQTQPAQEFREEQKFERRLEQKQVAQAETRASVAEEELERGREGAETTLAGIDTSSKAGQAYKSVVEAGGTERQAQQAFDNTMRQEVNRVRTASTTGRADKINPKQLDDMASSIGSQIGRINRQLKDKNIKRTMSDDQIRDQKLRIKELNKQLDIIDEAKTIQMESRYTTPTTEALGEAGQRVKQRRTEEFQKEFGQEEKRQGAFGILPGKQGPAGQQQKAFKEEFGEKPQFDEQGRLVNVPQEFKGTANVVDQVGGQANYQQIIDFLSKNNIPATTSNVLKAFRQANR